MLLVAVGFAVAWCLTRTRPCRATFEKVAVGMSRAEVEAVVGGPGEYAPVPAGGPLPGGVPPGATSGEWEGSDATFVVLFAPDGAVRWTFVSDGNAEPGALDHLRNRLGF